MRQVVEALTALSASPNGFTASELAARVRALSKQSSCQYGPRHAAYDRKKLRGNQIVRRIGHTRRYEPLPTGLRAMTALLVLRDKAVKPLLAATHPLCPTRGAHSQRLVEVEEMIMKQASKSARRKPVPEQNQLEENSIELSEDDLREVSGGALPLPPLPTLPPLLTSQGLCP
jgi:hypothetical protein